MDNYKILFGLFLILIFYLFNKKENYDNINVDTPQSSEKPQRDKIIDEINENKDTIKYLKFLLVDEIDAEKIINISEQIKNITQIISALENKL